MKVKKINPEAIIPTRAHAEDIGLDVYSVVNCVIPPKEHVVVPTGIAAQAPEGCYIRVAPRSGLAAKFSIDVLAGVVDRNYTGEIKVILLNNSNRIFTVTAGDRIAQLVCEQAKITEVEEVLTLEYTDREGDGFGSTGK